MVKIYTTSTCPKCKILKKKMESKNIDFEEITDMEAMMALGFLSVPWLEVDGELMDFNEANTWINTQR